MTIRRGDDWGCPAQRPAELRVLGGDRALATALADGSDHPTAVSSGDLYRTVGGRPLGGVVEMQAVPLDLLQVRLGDGTVEPAVAHVVARRTPRGGGWFRGEVLFVMNAQFMRQWNLAPRGHPNDGVAEALRIAPSVSVRQRLMAARRAEHGSHVPHPGLEATRVTSHTWAFLEPLEVLVDGARIGVTDELTVDVRPDAATLHI